MESSAERRRVANGSGFDQAKGATNKCFGRLSRTESAFPFVTRLANSERNRLVQSAFTRGTQNASVRSYGIGLSAEFRIRFCCFEIARLSPEAPVFSLESRPE